MTKILVVDDDIDLRETLVDVLSDRGFDVVGAQHGAAALEAVKTADLRPDLILLDIEMPVMDGATFAIERKKEPRLASVPVIVLTAHRDGPSVGRRVGAVLCLEKPVRLDSLMAAIASATTS